MSFIRVPADHFDFLWIDQVALLVLLMHLSFREILASWMAVSLPRIGGLEGLVHDELRPFL